MVSVPLSKVSRVPSFPRIVPIVEGPGDVSAVPALLRKLLVESSIYNVAVAPAKNAHGRGNLDKKGGLERFIRYAWKDPECGAIMVLVDSDDDCPKELALSYAHRIEALGVLFPVVIVCAKRMYETWLVASFETIAGHDIEGRRGPSAEVPQTDVESIGNCKTWITDRMAPGRIYKETTDQEAMTHLLDASKAISRSRSFRRLVHAVGEAVQAIESGAKTVSPRQPTASR
jgi:hypothetical protein